MKLLIAERTQKLKELAVRHGFMGVGISKAERMDEEAGKLEEWLSKGYHGEMAYMANHFEMRVDPTKLMPGAKSVVSLMYNYFPGESNKTQESLTIGEDLHLREKIPDTRYQTPDSGRDQIPPNPTEENSNSRIHLPLTTHYSPLTTDDSQLTNEDIFKISKYAYGEDYHKVVRRKLKELVAEMRKEIGDFHGRVFVDSAPVMERDWAKRSGLGWIGKNTLLIHPKKGSYFFLAEIILDVEFDYDQPMRDHCGTCTKCIEACPTEAISPEGYVLDGSKCISYLTIELKSRIPESFRDKMEDWIFGCDICQDVCPWNRFSTSHQEPAFDMPQELQEMKKEDWIEMTEIVFNDIFLGSPLKRSGYQGLKRNIEFLQKTE